LDKAKDTGFWGARGSPPAKELSKPVPAHPLVHTLSRAQMNESGGYEDKAPSVAFDFLSKFYIYTFWERERESQGRWNEYTIKSCLDADHVRDRHNGPLSTAVLRTHTRLP
jgi:hypothetical protein